MALVVTKYPQISIKAKTSKWSAVHHPITFEFQRQDLQVKKAITGLHLGYYNVTKIYVNGNIPTTLKVGQYITYVVNNKSYKTKVVSITSNVYISVDRISSTQLNGGYLIFNEAYNSYYTEVQIWGVNSSNTFELIGTTKCASNDSGQIKVNVQEWLQTESVFQNKFTYNKINQSQLGEGGQFNITWREIFNGVTTNANYSLLNPIYIFYWVNASKQIKDIYSQNMADYNLTNDTSRTNKAKFLSVFDKPTYFAGYPFSLSFIYSETLENKALRRREHTKNINGTQIANTTDLLDMGGRGFVNRLMLKQSYTSNIKTIDVWLEIDATATIYTPIHWDDDYSSEVFSPWGTLNEVNTPFRNNLSFY